MAKKLCVRPRLIVERLMSEEDKEDMRNGDLPIEALECHIRVWMDNGMPDYAHGLTMPLEEELRRKKYAFPAKAEESKEMVYRKPFVDPRKIELSS